MKPICVISGGQAGADRAGLDFAIARGLLHGGWCPHGRRAEDGPIPAKYLLSETATANYPARTKKNVENSDGTVIFVGARGAGRGSILTQKLCDACRKPVLVLCVSEVNLEARAGQLSQWVTAYNVRTLNVAGSRESTTPGIYKLVYEVLTKAFSS